MVRIRGLVKASNYVKSQLQQGIHPSEVDSLQKFVFNSVNTVEAICQEAQASPLTLPARSRNAYLYLKSIDWQNLPLTHQQQATSPTTSPQTLHLKNVVKQQNNLHQQLQDFPRNYTATQLNSLRQIFLDYVGEIEAVCQQNQVSPVVLATRSRKAYAWMKFLGNEHYLQRHIETLQTLQTLVQQSSQAQWLNFNDIQITLTHVRNLYKCRYAYKGNLELQLNEGFIVADEAILAAVVRLGLKEKNPDDHYQINCFAVTEAYREILLELDLIAEVDAENPQGRFYNLEALFNQVNQEYFAGEIVKPRLTWNKTLTHRKLGHYEPSRDKIVMSQTLDQPDVPPMVVEFVLYHELLHKQHGAKWINQKRWVHTPEFRRDEQQFRHYQEVQQWLDHSDQLA